MRTTQGKTRLVKHVIGYWTNGSTWVPANPPRKMEKPFVVRISRRYLIPVNVMLYAESEEDAKRVVLEAIKMSVERSYNSMNLAWRHGAKILEGIESGELKVEAEPFPRHYIVKVPWADNDTI